MTRIGGHEDDNIRIVAHYAILYSYGSYDIADSCWLSMSIDAYDFTMYTQSHLTDRMKAEYLPWAQPYPMSAFVDCYDSSKIDWSL